MNQAKDLQAADLLNGPICMLDAALLAAQSAVEEGPVHKLRTATRRMEAQLVLVDRLPGVSQHPKEMAEVHRLLKLLRRAAAKVRDLDVQIGLVGSDLPEKAAVHEGTRGDQIRHEGRKLLKHLQKLRKAEAAELMATLHAESDELRGALQSFQKTALAEDPGGKSQRSPFIGFSMGELSQYIQDWFNTRSADALQSGKLTDQAQALARLQDLDEETLHVLRKAAKQCRYMAESLPKGPGAAKKLATRFEFLQEAGGRWHDWLLLEQRSSRLYGKKAALSQHYRHHRIAALAEYHLQLALEFTTGNHRASRKTK